MTMKDKADVLVIDDERGPRESLRMLLKHDYNVTLADSVDRGLQYLKSMSPDLIVLDLRMPDKSGIEGLREIREIDKDIAVIILTGYGELETAREAIHHGANEYMKKPFDSREMMDAVARNIARTRLNRNRSGAEGRVEELDRKIKDIVGEKDKMASLGIASSAFAHDVRNPLMIVLAYVEMLAEKLHDPQSLQNAASDGDIREYMENIEKNVNRCHKIAKDWNLLGKPDAIQFQNIDLAEMLTDIVGDASVFGKDNGVAVVAEEIGANLKVAGEPSLLERALFNICKNAVQAASMTSDGRVAVSAQRSGAEVEICVVDNGEGIEPEKLEWIFEPLRSDRSPGEGFGLGLYITKEVVELHNGSIAFDSAPGRGTTVIIKIPVAE